MTPIRNAGLVISPWRNGTGRRADIADGPGWVIAYAWLDQDAAFSDYRGHDRTIMLVDGPGFTLVDPTENIVVNAAQRFAPASFDGGATVACRIPDGPCRVLNVMTERVLARHSVEIIGDEAYPVEAPAPGIARVLVVLVGAATIQAGADTLRLDRFDACVLNTGVVITAEAGGRLGLYTLAPA